MIRRDVPESTKAVMSKVTGVNGRVMILTAVPTQSYTTRFMACCLALAKTLVLDFK